MATSPLPIPYYRGLARIATVPPELPASTPELTLRLCIVNAVVLLVAAGAGLWIALRAILIILSPGLAFGYLYWKRGLEAAMLSHFAIDLFVHVVRPLGEAWLMW